MRRDAWTWNLSQQGFPAGNGWKWGPASAGQGRQGGAVPLLGCWRRQVSRFGCLASCIQQRTTSDSPIQPGKASHTIPKRLRLIVANSTRILIPWPCAELSTPALTMVCLAPVAIHPQDADSPKSALFLAPKANACNHSLPRTQRASRPSSMYEPSPLPRRLLQPRMRYLQDGNVTDRDLDTRPRERRPRSSRRVRQPLYLPFC